MLPKSFSFFAILVLAASLVAGSVQAQGPKPRVKIQTNMGVIVAELEVGLAPETVKNFLRYVDDKFYDGTVFHRVIKQFMIQGGGFDKQMNQKPTRDPIKNEARAELKNKRGTLAMARTNDPNSATAQFFINQIDNSFLDFKNSSPQGIGYAVFGTVVEGMDVVDKIANAPTGFKARMKDVPVQDVVIESITRLK